MKYVKFVEVELESAVLLRREFTMNIFLNLFPSPQGITTCIIQHYLCIKIALFLDIPICKTFNKNCRYYIYYYPHTGYTFMPKQTV